ncbi:MAG: cytochrome b [Pseudomonadota bacterium]
MRTLIAALVAAMFIAAPAFAKETLEGVEVHPILGPIGVNDHRLPYHLDSLISLVLILYAIGVTYLMNHPQPGRRVIGIWGAALGCFGIAGTALVLQIVGAFSEVRPPIIPPDAIKPIVIRLVGLAFAAAGVVLAMVAIGQGKRGDSLSLGTRNEPKRYGRISRYYHWIIAILFIMLIPMGIFTSMIPNEYEYRQAYYVVHKTLGFTVLILAIARVAWLIMNPAPKLDPSLSAWEKFLAHGAHYTLYFFLFAFPISGYMLSTFAGKLSHFFFWDTPLLWRHDMEGLRLPSLIHKVVLPYLFYLVFIGHIVGALKHRFWDKHQDAFRRMVT